MEDLVVDTVYWKDRRVFLTGHTGFKGGWLSLLLQRLGAEICGYALAPVTTPSLYTEARIENGMQSIFGDINDYGKFKKALSDFQPETVFHLAAQSLVRESYHSPLQTFHTNIIGTANLLDILRSQPSVKSTVIITSDKCYENLERKKRFTETDPLGGKDPYSASKACAEVVTASYRSSFLRGEGKSAVATARAGNVIGGGDWAQDRLVPDIVRAFSKGDLASIRNPGSTRPWQHVLEPLSGYLLLAQKLERDSNLADAWNFGPDQDDGKTVSWVADCLSEIWGEGAEWRSSQTDQTLSEAGILSLDSSKARQGLGWKPKMNLHEELTLTVKWYKAFFQGKNVRSITEAQIEEYLDK